MKTLVSVFGGAMTITEQAGVVQLNWDESLGGGKAAGFLKGQGSVVLDGMDDLKLGEDWAISKLPAALQPVAEVVEGVANSAIAAIE